MNNSAQIVIAVMPFSPITVPNLGVSLLKSSLENNGYLTKILYFNLKMADEIGLNIYNDIIDGYYNFKSIVGELLFSNYLFKRSFDWWKNLPYMLKRTDYSKMDFGKIIDEIRCIEKLIPQFIEDCACEIIEESPKLIGFSNSYQQTCSSLSVVKKVKEKVEAPIIFGGANCEGQMGFSLLKSFPEINYICSGDGDISFIQLAKNLLGNEPVPKIRGILTRESTEFDIALTNPIMFLDKLLYPNFDDYFNMLWKTSIKNELDVKIPLETSRGCWWGEISHCTFCGLNGSTMKFRNKSAERIINEIKDSIDRYSIRAFQFADNILDPHFVKDLFPKIINEKMDLWMFYETKSNLSREQLKCMKEAGVKAIQPGIESLSDPILTIMGKGVTSIQNIYFLKACRELEIWPYWNILFGFPGEPPEEYNAMTELIPSLVHLYPPESLTKIQLSRFTPYFWYPKRFGISHVRPLEFYKIIFPLNESVLKEMVYFFDYDYTDGRNVDSYVKNLEHEVLVWKNLWREEHPPDLNMVKVEGKMVIIRDTRPCACERTYILSDFDLRIFELCQRPIEFNTLINKLKIMCSQKDKKDIVSALSTLEEKKLLLKIKDQYLSLPIPITE